MDETKSSSAARFTRRVGLFTFGTLVSRLLGVVRESVFAYLFGAGLVTDAFNVAFRIPNFFRDLFAESALSAAFVPTVVQSIKEGNRAKTWRFAANMLNVMLLAIGLLVVTGIVFAPQVTRLVAMGFTKDPAKLHLTVVLTRIMFPFLLFVALAAWAMGILNACGTFFVPAVAPGAFNVVSIVVPLLTYGWLRSRGVEPITGMAAGVSVGAVAQLLVQWPHLHRYGFRYRPVLDLRDPELHRVLLRWVPMVLGLATWQINFLVNTFLLTFLSEGSITWISYAYRIQQLPAGLFGAAIGSVALAEYSHQTAGGKTTAIRERFHHAMGLVSALTLPAAALLFVLAVPVVRLVYQHGRFTPQDTAFTAQALALYCLGIWPAAATRNCAAGFYSLGDTRTPALIAVGVVALNIAMNLMLMRAIGFRSFALASSVAQLANFTLLFLLLRRRAEGLSARFSTAFRILAASVGAGILTYVLSWLYERLIPVANVWFRAGQIALAGCIGLAAFFLLARLIGAREVTSAFSETFRRQPRSTSLQIDNAGSLNDDNASNS